MQLLTGVKGMEYIDAMFAGDTAKLTRLLDEFLQQQIQQQSAEHQAVGEKYGVEQQEVFMFLDSAYPRKESWSTGIVVPSRYGTAELKVRFNSGTYDLFSYYCDETGYDQGVEYIERQVPHGEIIVRLQRLCSNQST